MSTRQTREFVEPPHAAALPPASMQMLVSGALPFGLRRRIGVMNADSRRRSEPSEIPKEMPAMARDIVLLFRAVPPWRYGARQ